MNSSISKTQVIGLLRAFYRHANKMSNFNFKEHAKRRIIYGFRMNKNISEPQLTAEYKKGLDQLELVRRQAIISSLYPDVESVVVNRNKKH